MTTRMFGALLGGLLATAAFAMPFAALAQDASKSDVRAATTKTEGADSAQAETKAKRPLTAQQLKMKECGAKWQEEKKIKGVKGLEAWNRFRSDCMKS